MLFLVNPQQPLNLSKDTERRVTHQYCICRNRTRVFPIYRWQIINTFLLLRFGNVHYGNKYRCAHVPSLYSVLRIILLSGFISVITWNEWIPSIKTNPGTLPITNALQINDSYSILVRVIKYFNLPKSLQYQPKWCV